MQDALATRPDLRRVVVELTEHSPVDDLEALRRETDELRARGALIALDDAGSGYSGLQQLAALRPQIVKLDRALVSDADTDPVRMALAEMVGEFAGRIDAWLLAEGMETAAELAAFTRLGVPLAQGWVLGRPGAGFAPLAPDVVQLVRTHAARVRLTESVAACCARSASTRTGRNAAPARRPGRSLGSRLAVAPDPRTGETFRAPVSLRVTRRPGSPRRSGGRSPGRPRAFRPRALHHLTAPSSACSASKTSRRGARRPLDPPDPGAPATGSSTAPRQGVHP